MDNKNNSKKYIAFISYNHEDEKWAKWLRHKLEYYHLPTALKKENPHLPPKLRPVFQDKVELASGKLKDEIIRSLDASQNLIVICSPRSAGSMWVSDEAQHFIDSNRGNKIIPFIIEGTPNSANPKNECYPKSLRELKGNKELLGINVNENGRQAAAIKVIASILNVRFDSLWQRHKRKQIRNRIIYSFLSVLVIFFGIFAFNYFKTSKEYYTSYEICKGMPVGIDKINDDSELKSKMRHYVFESSRGKLRTVYCANPFGCLESGQSSWSQFKSDKLVLNYEGDRLSSITIYNANNSPQYKYVYSEDYTKVDIKDIGSGDGTSAMRSSSSTMESLGFSNNFDINTVFDNTKSQVSRYVYEYDQYGFIKKILFKRYNGSNETGYDENGISGVEFSRDSIHRVTKKLYLSENGQYTIDKMGCAGSEYKYNTQGDVIYERFFNEKNENQLSDFGYAISTQRYNNGEFIGSHYGVDGKPIMNQANFHKIKTKIKGDTVFTYYYDIYNQPTYMFFKSKNFGFYHLQKSVYNKKGKCIEIMHYDTEEKPCYNSLQYHKQVLEYDDNGRNTRIIFYNTKDERQITAYGISEVCATYHEETNNVETLEYFRRPGIRADHGGISKRVYKYSGGRIISSACYDINDMPSNSVFNFGVPIVELSYDDYGNVTDVYLKDGSGTNSYFDDSKIAHYKAEYKGMFCTKLSSFNKNNILIECPDGYTTKERIFDDKGRMISLEFRDAEDSLINSESLGYAKIDFKYDEKGRIIEQRTKDSNGDLMICKQGWAVKKQTYKNNMPYLTSYYGVNDEPIPLEQFGCYSKITEFDERRNLTVEKYLGKDNQLMNSKFGMAMIKYAYNIYGLNASMSFFDTNGTPIVNTHGYHKRIMMYNKRHCLIKSYYVDTNESITINEDVGYAIEKCEYDDAGRPLIRRYFDECGVAINDVIGIHKTMFKYNSDGDVILDGTFNKEGDLVLREDIQGCVFALKYCKYNNDGRINGLIIVDEDCKEQSLIMSLESNGKFQGYLRRDELGDIYTMLLNSAWEEVKGVDNLNKYKKMLDAYSRQMTTEFTKLISPN